jgi:hypothetical protein
MVTVPALTPVATPVEELMVATAVLLDDQTPPGVASLSVVLCPIHRLATVLVIPATVGNALTVTV